MCSKLQNTIQYTYRAVCDGLLHHSAFVFRCVCIFLLCTVCTVCVHIHHIRILRDMYVAIYLRCVYITLLYMGIYIGIGMKMSRENDVWECVSVCVYRTTYTKHKHFDFNFHTRYSSSLWLCLYTNQLFSLCATQWTTVRITALQIRIGDKFLSVRTVCIACECVACDWRVDENATRFKIACKEKFADLFQKFLLFFSQDFINLSLYK